MTHLSGRYFGKTNPLFWLYMWTAFLTLITFGIYRFWAKTRIRKYIWSATAGGEDSFEYTGTGLEKFLGFLVAIVILAVFLGLLNMVLMFIGLNVMGLFDDSASPVAQVIVIYANLLALLPLMLFAVYRARRYKLARTRWRGLRFGMENGAWGYVARALGYGLLTLVSLGALMPLGTFRLEKYMIDRTWYGDAKLVQSGTWTALYGGMKHIAVAAAILIGGVAIAVALDAPGFGALAGFVGYIWLIVGFVYYRVFAFNYLMANRVLDGAVLFEAEAKTSRVISIVLIGVLVVFLAALIGVLLLGLVMFAVMGANAMMFVNPETFDPSAMSSAVALIGSGTLFVLYIALILVIGGVNLVMITQKIIAHVVGAVTVTNARHLDQIQQRAADAGADAEGFADALDIGGAI